MTTIEEIYAGAERLINQIIRKEIVDQGHHLTGNLEESLDYSVVKSGKEVTMEGFAAHYGRFVNDGVPARSASMKQWPFLVEYFKLRGLSEKEAGGAAAATIKVWMKEGMSTQASKRFSKTGARQQMIESAFTGNESKIDEYMTGGFDFVVEEKFQQEKSETI